MHTTDKKRAIIASKRGQHAAVGMNGDALDRAILAIFPQVRADGLDGFVNGYHLASEEQQRFDSQPDHAVEHQRARLMERGFDVRLDPAAKVGKIFDSVFPKG